MKKSLFFAFALSVIASGSLYANDLSKVNDLNAKSRVVANSVAEIIYSHAPIFFGDVKHHHGPRKVHSVEHNNCCKSHCHCCPPPAHGQHKPHKPHKFGKGYKSATPHLKGNNVGPRKDRNIAPPKGPGRGNKWGDGRR